MLFLCVFRDVPGSLRKIGESTVRNLRINRSEGNYASRKEFHGTKLKEA